MFLVGREQIMEQAFSMYGASCCRLVGCARTWARGVCSHWDPFLGASSTYAWRLGYVHNRSIAALPRQDPHPCGEPTIAIPPVQSARYSPPREAYFDEMRKSGEAGERGSNRLYTVQVLGICF